MFIRPAIALIFVLGFFNSVFSQKQKEQLADHFSKPKAEKQKSRLNSPFSSEKQKRKERQKPRDHFSREKKKLKRSEDDLTYRAKPRKIRRKNFNGERKRFFNNDPNKRKKKRSLFRFKAKDPFGRKKKDTPNNSPRREGDLFNNGVLPKMKDFR